MVERILSKVRVIVLGNLHEVLDATIDLNSMAAVKQHMRDLEEAENKLKDEAAASAGTVSAINRRIAELTASIKNDEEDINTALDGGNKDLAVRLQQRQTRSKEDLESKKGELVTANQTKVTLDDAVRRLDGKRQEMMSRIHQLEDLDRQTRAKESAAHSLDQAASLTAGDPSASIDSVEDRLNRRASVAGSHLDRAMEGVTSSLDADVAQSDAEAAINERLKQRQAGAAPQQ